MKANLHGLYSTHYPSYRRMPLSERHKNSSRSTMGATQHEPSNFHAQRWSYVLRMSTPKAEAGSQNLCQPTAYQK